MLPPRAPTSPFREGKPKETPPGVAVGVVRLRAHKEREGIVERDSKVVDNFRNDIHLIMLQDRPEQNGSRPSAGARLYVRTADVIEAHAVGGRGLHTFQCYGSRPGKTK